MQHRTKPKGEKFYRGAYTYLKNGSVYCEEEFEVFRDHSDLSYHFVAEQHSRVSTGELLTVHVDYIISKDYIPQSVFIQRVLGKEIVHEIFKFESRDNIVNYTFKNGDQSFYDEIHVQPKFYISTPVTCTSLIFLKSKKEDVTSKNYYQTITSFNQWFYSQCPTQKTIIAQRTGTGSETMMIGGSSLQGIAYKIIEGNDGNEDEMGNINPPALRFFSSKYVTIPYRLDTEDGIRIQIKYLNNLDKES